VPAPAVIPAPIAYIKVVAVKKLVVEPGPDRPVRLTACTGSGRAFLVDLRGALRWAPRRARTFTLKKLECSKQALARIH
jgi:hypothetical protein